MNEETKYRDINRRQRANLQPVPYLKREVDDRICDFEEVILGYDDELAMAEAERCLQCPQPQACLQNCPVGNDIPEAIWQTSQGNFVEAGLIFAQTSPLPEVCGRVCPNLCQQGCVLGQRNGPAFIGKIEAFVADEARRAGVLTIDVPEKKTGRKVAIVGSGPAGITVAEALVKKGHEATIYEAWPEPGGVLLYGIPSFKLEKHVVQNKIEDLRKAGVKFITNTRIGKDILLEDLQADFDAVFLGTGAGVNATMNIPGEDLAGIYQATDFLVRANVALKDLPSNKQALPDIGERVAVIGGGDTAVDCARSAIRLGAKDVRIVYRRTEAEMPGNVPERYTCLEEGVTIDYLQAPVAYTGDENCRLQSMRIIKMELGEPDKSGRRRPVPIEGSEEDFAVDTVVLAIGYWPDPELGKQNEALQTHKWGLIQADEEDGATTLRGVFAAGDNVHGPDLVITAVASAQKAAASIEAYLQTL